MFYEPVWEYEGYTLVRRPDTTRYHIYWRMPGGRTRRISTRTGDLVAAKQALRNFADRRKPGGRPHPSGVRLRDVFSGYIENRLSGKTRRDALSILRIMHDFLEEESIVFVAQFTPAMQRHFIRWRQQRAKKRSGRELSTATINKDLEFLRASLRCWLREGLVSEVPYVRLLPKPPARERYLTREEVERLLAACREPHLHRFVIIALHTLQRPGAILDLRCSQVELAHRRIDFRPPGWRQTSKRRPVVPITDTLYPILKAAMAESLSGYVVEYGGHPVRSIKTAFRSACRRAGLIGVTPYTLRHSAATLLAGAGVPLWQISGMLGHGITRTTEIYAKHAPEFLSQAACGLDAVLGVSIDSSNPRPGNPAIPCGDAASGLRAPEARQFLKPQRSSQRLDRRKSA